MKKINKRLREFIWNCLRLIRAQMELKWDHLELWKISLAWFCCWISSSQISGFLLEQGIIIWLPDPAEIFPSLQFHFPKAACDPSDPYQINLFRISTFHDSISFFDHYRSSWFCIMYGIGHPLLLILIAISNWCFCIFCKQHHYFLLCKRRCRM